MSPQHARPNPFGNTGDIGRRHRPRILRADREMSGDWTVAPGEELDHWRGICTIILGSRLQRWSLAASNGAGDHQSSGMRIAIRLALCSTHSLSEVLRG